MLDPGFTAPGLARLGGHIKRRLTDGCGSVKVPSSLVNCHRANNASKIRTTINSHGRVEHKPRP